MLELLLIVTFSGLILASHRKMGVANPFQIYFIIWFSIFVLYYFFNDTFISVQSEFFLLLLVVKLLALLILIVTFRLGLSGAKNITIHSIEVKNGSFLLGAQVLLLLAVPFAYKEALSLSKGYDIYSVIGYRQLRASMTEEGMGFGFLAYLFVLSFAVGSITVILYIQKKVSVVRLMLSIAISLFYVYLGTGRTHVLLFLILIFIPLALCGVVRLRGIILFVLLIFSLFIFIAGMTAKGVSTDYGFAENLSSFFENIRGYTVAPVLALAGLIDSDVTAAWGMYSFRIIFALAYSLGFSDAQPVALIKDYSYVPDPTNVYTVYEVYFRDFSYVGLFIPPIFLMVHWWLYGRAKKNGGIWLFYYAASVYPLIMQFFQDQYFSLFSTWIQFGIWYWLFLSAPKIKLPNMKI